MNSFLSNMFKKEVVIPKLSHEEQEKTVNEQLNDTNARLAYLAGLQIKEKISNDEIDEIHQLLNKREKLESKLGILQD